MSRAALAAGMVLTHDVVDQTGRTLIAAGTALTEKHLKRLKAWGIGDVSVDDRCVTRPADGPGLPSELGAEEQRVRERFRHVDLEHPMCRELLAQTLLRARQRGAAAPLEEG